MREIRFRLYHKPSGEMLDWKDLDLRNINEPDFDFGNNVLMQYTGLKDKNGKEIYDGDIVKKVSLNTDIQGTGIFGGTYKAGYYLKEKIFVVSLELDIENELLWEPCLPMNLTQEDEDNYSKEIENIGVYVIGNIFENPELLKA